jgi:hypothetical protein
MPPVLRPKPPRVVTQAEAQLNDAWTSLKAATPFPSQQGLQLLELLNPLQSSGDPATDLGSTAFSGTPAGAMGGLLGLLIKRFGPLPRLVTLDAAGDLRFITPVRRQIQQIAAEAKRQGVKFIDWVGGQERLAEAFGPGQGVDAATNARRYTRGFGATSPLTDSWRNAKEALDAYEVYRRGEEFTRENLRARRVTNVPSKLPNLKRAYSDQPLLAEGHQKKTNALGNLLVGDPREPPGIIPFDRVALYGVGADSNEIESALPAMKQYLAALQGVSPRQIDDSLAYAAYERLLNRELQDVYDAPTTQAGRRFGQWWDSTREVAGVPPGASHLSVLNDLGLLRPGALSTPEAVAGAARAVPLNKPPIVMPERPAWPVRPDEHAALLEFLAGSKAAKK